MFADLKKHSVRIKNSKYTIGTGFLIVPAVGEFAYILTAAHVFNGEKYPLTAQCYLGAIKGDKEQGKIIVSESDVTVHPGYDPQKDKDELQPQDTALIRVHKESWMEECSEVFMGAPKEGIPVAAVAYSGATFEKNIRIDTNLLYASLPNVDAESHQMTTTLDGDFIINRADPDKETGGMSGAVYAAHYQDQIIIVGIFCSTLDNKEPMARVNIIDLTAARELLQEAGVKCQEKEIVEVSDEYADEVWAALEKLRFPNNMLKSIVQNICPFSR